MNKKLSILKAGTALVMAAMLAVGAAGCGKTDGLSAGDGEPEIQGEAEKTYPVATIEAFKEAAGKYGDVRDMTDTLGYESAAVSTEDINLIYMKLDDAAAAKSMALGDKGTEGVELKVTYSGANYDYYEETVDPESEVSSEIGAVYGIYLRVDNMLILVTGTADNKDDVKVTAHEFYTGLGYPDFA